MSLFVPESVAFRTESSLIGPRAANHASSPLLRSPGQPIRFPPPCISPLASSSLDGPTSLSIRPNLPLLALPLRPAQPYVLCPTFVLPQLHSLTSEPCVSFLSALSLLRSRHHRRNPLWPCPSSLRSHSPARRARCPSPSIIRSEHSTPCRNRRRASRGPRTCRSVGELGIGREHVEWEARARPRGSPGSRTRSISIATSPLMQSFLVWCMLLWSMSLGSKGSLFRPSLPTLCPTILCPTHYRLRLLHLRMTPSFLIPDLWDSSIFRPSCRGLHLG